MSSLSSQAVAVPEDKTAKSTKAKKSEPAAPVAPAPLKPASASGEDNLAYDLKYMAAYDIAPIRASTKEALPND